METAIELFDRVEALPTASVPAIRSLRRELSRQLARASADTAITLARDIVGRSLQPGAPDLRWVAYELLHYHRRAAVALDLALLEELGASLNSWDSVDVFALYLAGPAWRREQIADEDIHRWAGSGNRWRRRAALVCTVALNNKARGGQGDAHRTLKVCERLAADPDDMVVKALSWALRQLVWHDRVAVEDFLARHSNTLAARVKREVGNQLRAGRKNPRPSTRQ